MKNLLFIAGLLFSFHAKAQDAGKVGALIKNVATQAELKTPQNEMIQLEQKVQDGNRPTTNNNTIKGRFNNNVGTTTGGARPSTQETQAYNWSNNFGYAEVFLRIPEEGLFTVTLNNQMISNDNGKFRFYDLNSGRNVLEIYQYGYLIYKSALNIRNNNRLVLDFFTKYGLYKLDEYQIQNNYYQFNRWDDIWNNPYGGNGYNWSNGPQEQYSMMNVPEFDNFVKYLTKSNYFDKDKMDAIRQQSKKTFFTTLQIKSLLALVNFESNRLTLAKDLYPKCIDPKNFYTIYDIFSFSSNKKKLMEFVNSYDNQRF